MVALAKQGLALLRNFRGILAAPAASPAAGQATPTAAPNFLAAQELPAATPANPTGRLLVGLEQIAHAQAEANLDFENHCRRSSLDLDDWLRVDDRLNYLGPYAHFWNNLKTLQN